MGDGVKDKYCPTCGRIVWDEAEMPNGTKPGFFISKEQSDKLKPSWGIYMGKDLGPILCVPPTKKEVLSKYKHEITYRIYHEKTDGVDWVSEHSRAYGEALSWVLGREYFYDYRRFEKVWDHSSSPKANAWRGDK